MKPLVQMKNIRMQFATVLANDYVNFDLYPGEVHSLVGENGAGKTTLMRILYGLYTPDSGNILIDGKEEHYNIAGAMDLGIAMVHQNFMQVEEMSILENIIMSDLKTKAGFIDFKNAATKVSDLLARFGLKADLKTIVGGLSVGERQTIEIIKALYRGARILILDEPTAVLTPQETDELFAIIRDLKKSGTTIVFISHKLREVVAISDRISVIRRGKITGSFDAANVSEADIARAMIGKQHVDLLKKDSDTIVDGNIVCDARNLLYFDDHGIPKVQNFSLQVREGEILGIGGVEGNGQSELLDLLLGMKTLSNGTIHLLGKDITRASIKERRRHGLGIISDDRIRIGLSLPSSLEENLICGIEKKPEFSRFGILRKKNIAEYAEKMVKSFDVRGVGKKGKIAKMSGGNLQKIVLAREIDRNPRLLIAAQPTRGLDIGAINFVREQLFKQKRMGTAILLITADLEELMSLSDRILIMYKGRCSGEVTDVSAATEESLGLMMGGISNEKGRKANE